MATFRFARNRGGWPLRVKHVFDTASHRRTNKAIETLYNAQERISATATFIDPPCNLWMSLAEKDAWQILQDAKQRVGQANDLAQVAAKARPIAVQT